MILVFVFAGLILGSSAQSAQCPAPNGDFPNPSSEVCTTFFRCILGRPTLFRCPANQRFDFLFRICRPQAQVNCNRQLQVYTAPPVLGIGALSGGLGGSFGPAAGFGATGGLTTGLLDGAGGLASPLVGVGGLAGALGGAGSLAGGLGGLGGGGSLAGALGGLGAGLPNGGLLTLLLSLGGGGGGGADVDGDSDGDGDGGRSTGPSGLTLLLLNSILRQITAQRQQPAVNAAGVAFPFSADPRTPMNTPVVQPPVPPPVLGGSQLDFGTPENGRTIIVVPQNAQGTGFIPGNQLVENTGFQQSLNTGQDQLFQGQNQFIQGQGQTAVSSQRTSGAEIIQASSSVGQSHNTATNTHDVGSSSAIQRQVHTYAPK